MKAKITGEKIQVLKWTAQNFYEKSHVCGLSFISEIQNAYYLVAFVHGLQGIVVHYQPM